MLNAYDKFVSVLNVKELVSTFNQEKAQAGRGLLGDCEIFGILRFKLYCAAWCGVNKYNQIKLGLVWDFFLFNFASL